MTDRDFRSAPESRVGAANEPQRLYSSEWYSCDGFADGEIRATDPDGPWPAMVLLELSGVGCNVGLTITVEDARDLAAKIGAAAQSASWAMRRAKTARAQASALDGEAAAPTTPEASPKTSPSSCSGGSMNGEG